jgi:prolyl-tRNA synthetase
MRWTRLFIPTLRADPGGALSPSHRLLLRAGYVREATGGQFHLLALARRSMRRIVNLMRRHLDEAGFQEVLLAESGCSLQQRIEAAAEGELRSYKQLPQSWYQYDTRRREDAKPGLGLIGGAAPMVVETCRLSFEPTAAGVASGEVTVALGRCGISPAMAACPGNMLGLFAVTPGGEHALVRDGDSWAHPDLAFARAAPPLQEDPANTLLPEPFETPDQKTIAEVSAFTGLPETLQIKSLVYATAGGLVLALVRGDHSLSEAKLERVAGKGGVRPATAREIETAFGASAGSLGPVGVRGIRLLADLALQGRRNMICGANRNGWHLRNVTPGKDFHTEFHDLRKAAELKASNAVEIYSAALQPKESALRVTGAQGKDTAVYAETAVIYLDRILAAAAELHHDAAGLRWPPAVAPFDVVITPVDQRNETVHECSERLYEGCRARSVDALLDDRDDRAGVKFNDADLIGVPYRLTIGKKSADGVVELKDRRSGITTSVSPAEAIACIREKIYGD